MLWAFQLTLNYYLNNNNSIINWLLKKYNTFSKMDKMERIDDEEYEILDECGNDEEIIIESVNNANSQTVNDNDVTIIDVKMSTPKLSNIDFKSSLYQLNDQQIIENFSEIETLVLDSSVLDSISSSTKPLNVDEKNLWENDSDVDDPRLTELKLKWYEDKIISKKIIVKERLFKLSRVLKNYSPYREWLEKLEKQFNIVVCPLEPTQKCLVDQMEVNRWKFVCSKKTEVKLEEVKGENNDITILNNFKTFWKLDPCKVTNGNNAFEIIPSFVLRVVEIFEEFINLNDQSLSNNNSGSNNSADCKEIWTWLLIRSNTNNELMLFATGNNISSSSMDRLKKMFELGKGSFCKVKSLYCKSLFKASDGSSTSTIKLLTGTESLNEFIENFKIKLAPKTNFWLNTAGAENLSKVVYEFLEPQHNATVVEVGCGLGLIGLMMADKCQHIIGYDVPSEIEEAEITCELNGIKNATFIKGNVSEAIAEISNELKECKGLAVVNANSSIGQMTEVITGLRKIPSLRVVVVITTLTKKSVRSIIELTRPEMKELGEPFIPSRAIIVDTLPTGPHFEVVIRMERSNVNRFYNSFLKKCKDIDSQRANSPNNFIKNPLNKHVRLREAEPDLKPVIQNLDNEFVNINSIKKSPLKDGNLSQKDCLIDDKKLVKNPFHDKERKKDDKKDILYKTKIPLKRKGILPKENSEINDKKIKLSEPQKSKNNSDDKYKYSFNEKHSPKEKRPREDDLRNRLSSNSRIDNANANDLREKMRVQQRLLEETQAKLNSTNHNDPNSTKQIKNMLSLIIEQTNQIQNQLSRSSVWDRIAPADKPPENDQPNEPVMKGRSVKEVGQKDIVIIAPNQSFVEASEPRRISNIQPAEPDLIMPLDNYIVYSSSDHFHRRTDNSGRSRGRDKDRDRDRREGGGGGGGGGGGNSRSRNRNHNSRGFTSITRRSSPTRIFSNSEHLSRSRSPLQVRVVNTRDLVTPPPKLIPSPPRNNLYLPSRIKTPSPKRNPYAFRIKSLSPKRNSLLLRAKSPSPSPSRNVSIANDWDIPNRSAIDQELKIKWQKNVWKADNSRNEDWNVLKVESVNSKISSQSDNRSNSGFTFDWAKNNQLNKSKDNWLNSNQTFVPKSTNESKINTSAFGRARNDFWIHKHETNQDDFNEGLPEDARDPWDDYDRSKLDDRKPSNQLSNHFQSYNCERGNNSNNSNNKSWIRNLGMPANGSGVSVGLGDFKQNQTFVNFQKPFQNTTVDNKFSSPQIQPSWNQPNNFNVWRSESYQQQTNFQQPNIQQGSLNPFFRL